MWKLCKECVRQREQRIDVNDLLVTVSYIDADRLSRILSLTLFEKMPILRALEAADSEKDLPDNANQLILFDF
jgi:hypothetical protein